MIPAGRDELLSHFIFSFYFILFLIDGKYTKKTEWKTNIRIKWWCVVSNIVINIKYLKEKKWGLCNLNKRA